MKQTKHLTLMCVQPCIPYYAWQVEVMLRNFISLGIHEQHDIHVIFAYNKNESDWQKKVDFIMKLANHYTQHVSFFFYQDTREYPISYISGIRPNCLKQHFINNPYLEDEVIFYHDCDIVFTKYPTFLENYVEDDFNWYLSDTISYIGHNYIASKGQDVLDLMTSIVGINPKWVEKNELNSGGAQYVMKEVDWKFFHKVEKDCERLFKEVNVLNNEKKRLDPSHHELQIWCADMWALLWNAWMRGFETKVEKDLDFCWATDNISRWDETYIFHNAGVVDSVKDTIFYKADYRIKLPYDIDFEKYDKTKASYNYLKMIQETSKFTCYE